MREFPWEFAVPRHGCIIPHNREDYSFLQAYRETNSPSQACYGLIHSNYSAFAVFSKQQAGYSCEGGAEE